ncbi:MAG: arginine--tRNA ligase [Solirubrobacterales bacterium]|nr:arginine--tRNA ligase [Solirubrobacterales bacterium]
MTPLGDLRRALDAAAAVVAGAAGPLHTPPTLERPKQAGFGDYATNAALVLAPVVKAAPRDVAERVGRELEGLLGAALDRVEVAGPGFLNLFLSDDWHAAALAHVLDAGDGFGGGGAPRPERINVEYVSANPTGPLHVGHARNAAYGDAISRIFAFHGHEVTREYYVNDFGSQVANLGTSLKARARGEEPPNDGYVGAYVTELAAAIPGAARADTAELARRGVALMLERIEASLAAFRAPIDVWASERALHEGDPSAVDRALARLEELGQTYRSEGALWLRTTAHGDDKDRVLLRGSGELTYFASDLAYLLDKRERGFERLVYVLGADHHGYRGRMRAAYEAFGGDPDEELELLIMQFVNLLSAGTRSSMSKRRGEFVTLDDLIAEIGVDPARWFLLQRSHDTAVDLDLAREQSAENPVYYVQYAHARIASIRAKAGQERVRSALAGVGAREGELDPAERALVKKLLAFPEEVAEAAQRRAAHRIAGYALELAQVFTAFYRDCLVVGAPGPGVEHFRLGLCVASQRTIACALALLGVAAPESM